MIVGIRLEPFIDRRHRSLLLAAAKITTVRATHRTDLDENAPAAASDGRSNLFFSSFFICLDKAIFFSDEFAERNVKQELIIADQQKTIRLLKEEQNQMRIFWEKQVNALKSTKEKLEKKFSRLVHIHQEDLLQCRYNYECRLQGLLSHETRLDLEQTILCLKQQTFAQQNRLNFLQAELDHYIAEYGHRPSP